MSSCFMVKLIKKDIIELQSIVESVRSYSGSLLKINNDFSYTIFRR